MSKENVKGFYDSAKSNDEMLKEATTAGMAGNIVQFAKEKGFEFTQAEYDEFVSQMEANAGELSDDQLEKTVGGAWYDTFLPPKYYVHCYNCGWEIGPFRDLASSAAAMLKLEHMAKTKHMDVSIRHE